VVPESRTTMVREVGSKSWIFGPDSVPGVHEDEASHASSFDQQSDRLIRIDLIEGFLKRFETRRPEIVDPEDRVAGLDACGGGRPVCEDTLHEEAGFRGESRFEAHRLIKRCEFESESRRLRFGSFLDYRGGLGSGSDPEHRGP
jgi:hypothetical protein